MARVITASGHTAVDVPDANSALKVMATQRFDIAIVDLEMPGKKGPATIASLRAIDPALRMLVVSGYDDRRHVMAALDAGADGYLVKDEIAASLGSFLQSVRAGHTPLSPRVARIMVRQLRQRAPAGPVGVVPLGQSHRLPVRPKLG